MGWENHRNCKDGPLERLRDRYNLGEDNRAGTRSYVRWVEDMESMEGSKRGLTERQKNQLIKQAKEREKQINSLRKTRGQLQKQEQTATTKRQLDKVNRELRKLNAR